MTRSKFKQLREQIYSLVFNIDKTKDPSGGLELTSAYHSVNNAIEHIDQLGYRLGFLDPETNEYLDKRRKKDVSI